MIDMLPPGPTADILLRTAYLSIDDRSDTLENLIGIVGVGGEQAAARVAFDLVMPLGQEHLLDTVDGQCSLMERASAILWAFAHPWPSVALH
jgi:hypothetical protein